MKLKVVHRTEYRYSNKVALSPHRVLLRPRDSALVWVSRFELIHEPAGNIRWMRDSFDNSIAGVYFDEPSDKLVIEARTDVRLLEENPFDFIIEPYAVDFPFAYKPLERAALFPYLQVGSPASTKEVMPWLSREFPETKGSTVDLLTSINTRIFERFAYTRRDEPGVQSPDTTIGLGSGSCRDFARLFIEICRQLGIAARFASGYLYDPPGEGHFQNRAEGSLHAWAEVYLPGAGWKGFDPTNNILAGNMHIPTAVSSEPRLADPIQGSFTASRNRIESTMDVSLVIEKLED